MQIALGKGPDVSYRTWARYFYALHDVNFNVLGVVEPTGLEVYGNGCRLVERYEYTPYGERTVYSHGWLRADANGDGDVDVLDLNRLGADWGSGVESKADFNGDGDVDLLDNNALGSQWFVQPRGFSSDRQVSYPTQTSFMGGGIPSQYPVVTLCDIGHQGLVHDEAVGLIQNRERVLHPRVGRFMQRDITEYIDGLSFYAYLRSKPISLLDPLGKWAIRRNNGSHAVARAEKNDTIQSLAKRIKLNSSEFSKWLVLTKDPHNIRPRPGMLDTIFGTEIKLDSGERVSLSNLRVDDKICPNQEVLVPNTIALYSTKPLRKDINYINAGGSFIASLDNLEKQFKSAKYRVVYLRHQRAAIDPITGNPDVGIANRTFINMWKTEGLYGVAFAGHGNAYGYSAEATNDLISVAPHDVSPRYKLRFVFALSCFTTRSTTGGYAAGGVPKYSYWRSHVSDEGRFIGFVGAVDTMNMRSSCVRVTGPGP